MSADTVNLPAERVCNRCRAVKPASEFYVCGAAAGRPYLFSVCKPCSAYRNRVQKKGRKVPAATQRKYALKRWYGVTPEQIQDLLGAQQGVCAICAVPLTLGSIADHREREEEERVTGVVDHNHQTGEVRGVLCHPCNKGLGHFGDDPERVETALRYLRERQ